MTLPAYGPLSLNDINNEFGLGTNLNAYLGVRYYYSNAGTGTFPTSNISIQNFYNTRATSPVTPGTQTFTTSGYFIVPTYSVLTVTLRGGSGGGGGGSGNVSIGNNGGYGGTSYFYGYGTADYGRGGAANGTNGLSGANSDGVPAGGAGGTTPLGYGNNGGAGGNGGKAVLTLTNPVSGGTGPVIGQTVFITIGAGGSGGSGGLYSITTGVQTQYYQCGKGDNGSAGSVVVSWT